MDMGDIFQVRVVTTASGLTHANNMLYYRCYTPVSEVTAMDEFIAMFAGPWAGVLSAYYSVTYLELIDLFNLSVLETRTVDWEGTLTGEPMPEFVSVSWKNPRRDRAIRSGYKRIGPQNEASIAGGEPAPGFVSAIAMMSVALRADLVHWEGPLMTEMSQPVVVKRIPYILPSGETAYRLPENQGEAQYYFADAWDYHRITSQVSRKRR